MPAFSSVMPYRPMRRAKREVSDASELRSIVERAGVLHVGCTDAEGMFVVPMSFGFEVVEAEGAPRWTFWLHSAEEGRKAEAWAAGGEVALELDVPAGVVAGSDYACSYTFAYESVMATGQITCVKDAAEKIHGLECLMRHMAPGAPVTFSDEAVARVSVWRIDVEHLTGKRRPAPGMPGAHEAAVEEGTAPADSAPHGKKGGHKHGGHADKGGKHDGHDKGEKHGGHDAPGKHDGKPSKKELQRQIEKALGPERCPGCGHHCKLTNPSCGKGRRVRDRKLEKLGLKLG